MTKTIDLLLHTISQEQLLKLHQNAAVWLDPEQKWQVQVAGLESLRFLLPFDLPIESSLLKSAAQLNLRLWASWKDKQRTTNLLSSTKWADVLMDDQAQQQLPKQLLNSYLHLLLEAPSLVPPDVVCSLVKFTSFPLQETANFAIRVLTLLLDKEREMIKGVLDDRKQFLKENMHKIIRFQLMSKFLDNQIVLSPRDANDLIAKTVSLLVEVQADDLLAEVKSSLLKITRQLMGRMLIDGIANLVELAAHLKQDQMVDCCIEIILRVKRIELESELLQ